MLFVDGSFGTHALPIRGFVVAWMPISELPKFDPIPDPPEGWRFVAKGEAFDERAKRWSNIENMWCATMQRGRYDPDLAYIVPIDPPKPPEPQYRPFANAAEFTSYRERWIVNPASGVHRRVEMYGDDGAMGMSWDGLFRNRTFDDGSPFGVKVEQ
jgi:hypothetical protein